MPSYKLVYFDGRGRAETIRLVFVAAGIPFEDHRIKKEDWPALKPKTFAGYLPYLEVDGKVLVESIAIARFVAREGGLAGKCSFEQAQVDAVVDILSGFVEKGYPIMILTDAAQKETQKKEFIEKHFDSGLKLLEKFLGSKHYLVGDKLTLADLHLYSMMECMHPLIGDLSKHSPKLKELYDRVASQPKIAEYLKKRHETPF